MKSWTEFSNAVASIQIPNQAVKLIEKSSPTKIMVEIDTSKPFADVINKLSEIFKDVEWTILNGYLRFLGILT